MDAKRINKLVDCIGGLQDKIDLYVGELIKAKHKLAKYTDNNRDKAHLLDVDKINLIVEEINFYDKEITYALHELDESKTKLVEVVEEEVTFTEPERYMAMIIGDVICVSEQRPEIKHHYEQMAEDEGVEIVFDMELDKTYDIKTGNLIPEDLE